ncbi:MAG: hypothetical protein F6K18_04365 [Okeania sp. SIO2C2]|uniref:hypothetical protein n=1 Tax=Okeania sp. SIO2C2 TaxID=2607787 RepID=UPI0013B6CCA2|nr:hypothetical protein [Okeania sp. SIO2C2]NEP86112.1 hypothetical protein [Okeania sp. SIO2C2]
MLSEIKEFDGVQNVDLMPIEKAEPNAKSIGGFLVGILTAEINAKSSHNYCPHIAGYSIPLF